MNKLFAMFIRYTQVPEQQFKREATRQLFKLAEAAEKKKQLKVSSQFDFIQVTGPGIHIKVSTVLDKRQIWLENNQEQQRYSLVGSNWRNGLSEQIGDVFKEAIKIAQKKV